MFCFSCDATTQTGRRHSLLQTKQQGRRGFTLFEVSISLAIVAIGVISVVMLYPIGIKTQLMARYQILASAKVEEMVQLFNATGNQSHSDEHEGLGPWDVPLAYRAHQFDLEIRLQTSKYGLMPVPPTIAKRLDSENDEIHNLLSRGGRLYYSQPGATTGFGDHALYAEQPNEAQRLVIGIVGYAQHNDLCNLPWKAWPYYVGYPSPPLFASRFLTAWNRNTAMNTGIPDPYLPPNARTFAIKPLSSNSNKPSTMLLHEGATPTGTAIPGADPDCVAVFDAFWQYAYGDDPQRGPGPGNWTVEGAIGYIQAALEYAKKKGLPEDFYNPTTIPNPVPDFIPGTIDANGDDYTHTAWKQVQAMRFLSHAASTMTRWKTLAELGGQPSDPTQGVDIPANNNGSPAIKLTHDLITYYHDRCMNLIMRYSASFPYDWGAPRPAIRYQMMDTPLFEWDVFSPPLNGKIYDVSPGQSKIAAAQWRPLPMQPIHNIGVSMQYPIPFLPYSTLYSGGTPTGTLPDGSTFGSAEYNNFWGNQDHRTLTKPFQPAERCRQIVFWAVDWRSYEDCETAPSAPVDASKYPIISSFGGIDFFSRTWRNPWSSSHLRTYRNPEFVMLYMQDMTNEPTGLDVQKLIASYAPDPTWSTTPDKNIGQLKNRSIFSGLYGADRNFNLRLDRGNLPTSVRLKAAFVARFNYYDPRLTLSIR